MNKKLILALISEKGGGKGTAAKYFEQKYNAKVLRFSFFIEEMLASLGLPTNDRTLLATFIQKLRGFVGNDVLAQIMVRRIEKMKAKFIVVDGYRFPEEEEFLRSHLSNFFTVAISASAKTRYLRTKLRGERKNEDRFSFPQFLEDQKLPTELFIKRLMKKTDFIVDNNGSEEELYTHLDKLTKKLL